MNTKSLFLTISCFLYLALSFAQKKQNIYYLKDSGVEVSVKDSADFIRIIQEPDSGSVFYNLLEYYKDGTIKRGGKVSKYKPTLVYEETLVSYYRNGRKEEITGYSKGKPRGMNYCFYPDGKVKKTALNARIKISGEESTVTKVISYYDSTGNELIKNGTGFYRTFEQDPKIIEEGNYLDSVKHGMWKGLFSKTNAKYEEQYENGEFLSGVAINADGSSTSYSKVEEMPTYKGGIEKFLGYVARSYKYPIEAQRQRVSGKVIMSFVVEKDGRVTDVKVVKDIGYGTGEVAKEVIENSPKWIPGKQHGQPVRVHYTLPLVLQMNR